MKEILAATNNKHKLEELRTILGQHGIKVISAAEAGGISEVVEDADTFEGNAAKKAIETAQEKGMTVFADDSGLEVDALNGAPGIYSARYAGPNASHQDLYEKVLKELEGVEDRSARFVCVIALATPEGLIGTTRGTVEGKIALQAQGEDGFGYDPVFIPNGYDQSFAELGEEIKNSMSHRGNALKKSLEAGLFS